MANEDPLFLSRVHFAIAMFGISSALRQNDEAQAQAAISAARKTAADQAAAADAYLQHAKKSLASAGLGHLLTEAEARVDVTTAGQVLDPGAALMAELQTMAQSLSELEQINPALMALRRAVVLAGQADEQAAAASQDAAAASEAARSAGPLAAALLPARRHTALKSLVGAADSLLTRLTEAQAAAQTASGEATAAAGQARTALNREISALEIEKVATTAKAQASAAALRARSAANRARQTAVEAKTAVEKAASTARAASRLQFRRTVIIVATILTVAIAIFLLVIQPLMHKQALEDALASDDFSRARQELALLRAAPLTKSSLSGVEEQIIFGEFEAAVARQDWPAAVDLYRHLPAGYLDLAQYATDAPQLGVYLRTRYAAAWREQQDRKAVVWYVDQMAGPVLTINQDIDMLAVGNGRNIWIKPISGDGQSIQLDVGEKADTAFAMAVGLSSDGRYAAVAYSSLDSFLRIFEVPDKQRGGGLHVEKQVGNTVGSLVFSADGSQLFMADRGGITAFESRSSTGASYGNILRFTQSQAESINAVYVSPDLQMAATHGYLDSQQADGTWQRTYSIAVWNVSERRKVNSWTTSEVNFPSIVLSPDKTLVACAGQGSGTLVVGQSQNEMSVQLWRTVDGRLLHETKLNANRTPAVAFDPTGTVLAAITATGAAIIDVNNGEQLYELPTRASGPASLAFSRDGAVLAVGERGAISLWPALGTLAPSQKE